MKNHNLIQSLPKVKQKIHVIYCGEIGKDGYESKKRSMNSLSLRIVKTDSRKYNSLLCETYKTEIKVNIQWLLRWNTLKCLNFTFNHKYIICTQ